MKSIKNYIKTSLNDITNESLLDDDDDFYDTEHNKKVIEDWIKTNCMISGELIISDDFVVDCTGYVIVNNTSITSLTNGLFKWGRIGEYFDCERCTKLETLKGGPEYVDGNFYCSCCEKLTSLEGAPKEVRGGFDCSDCESLKSLKCAPKEVGKMFDCSNCENLKTLEGAPRVVDGDFYCSNCENLKITDSDRKKYKLIN